MFRVELPLLVLVGWASAGAAAGVIVDPPSDPDTLRSAWRYVGVKADPDAPTCPDPSPRAGWTTADMFPGTDNRLLSRFCVYENAGALPMAPDIPGLVRLDRDAMAVRPLGGVLATALAPAAEAHFKSQVGDFELPLTGGQRVRLAVVDTAATRESGGENYPGTSPHGYTLLNMARRLTCAGPSDTACVAQVSSRLALGWECFDRKQLDASCRNPTEGGLFGLIGEMAQAVHSEVRRWKAVGPQRLALNLSIGWDPSLGGLEVLRSDMPAPVAAVYAALEDAVCRGAWVVAAAGNREGGPTPEQGPILPAAWETRAAPSFATCSALGVSPQPADFPGPFGGTPYRPLVSAVAGLRADDGRVFNSRTASSPRLAAFADHALVTTLGGAPSSDLTGSSVAALVVSAASAAASYYRPGLKPYEVLEEVYGGARDLLRPADFCLGGSPCPAPGQNVHRVDLCGTLAYACRAGGPFCPAPLPPCAAALPLDLSAVDLTAFRQGALAIDLLALTSAYDPVPECRLEKLDHAPGEVPVDPCPHWQYYPRSPARATEPQPGSYPCPNCLYDQSTGELYVEIDDTYEGELSGATLKCAGKTWGLGGPEPWVAGDTAVIEGVSCAGDETVLVSFTVDGADSASSTVLVEP